MGTEEFAPQAERPKMPEQRNTDARQVDLDEWRQWLVDRNCPPAAGAWDRLTRWAPDDATSSEVKLSIGGDGEAPSQPARVEGGADDDAPGGFGSDLEPSPSHDGDGGALLPDGPRKRRHRELGDERTLEGSKRLKGAFNLDHSDCGTSDSSEAESLVGDDMDALDVVVSSVVVPRRRAVFNWRWDHLKEPGYTRGSLSRFRQALRRISSEEAQDQEEEKEDAEPDKGPAKTKAGRKRKRELPAPRREPTRRQPARKASAKISYAESD